MTVIFNALLATNDDDVDAAVDVNVDPDSNSYSA